jgi:ferredoxin
VPEELRAKLGNRIYGCDDCLAVCPWNKFAVEASELRYLREDGPPRLADLAALDDAAFRARFAGSPVKRIGLARFLRNVLYAIGNSGDPALLPAARRISRPRTRRGRGRRLGMSPVGSRRCAGERRAPLLATPPNRRTDMRIALALALAPLPPLAAVPQGAPNAPFSPACENQTRAPACPRRPCRRRPSLGPRTPLGHRSPARR